MGRRLLLGNQQATTKYFFSARSRAGRIGKQSRVGFRSAFHGFAAKPTTLKLQRMDSCGPKPGDSSPLVSRRTESPPRCLLKATSKRVAGGRLSFALCIGSHLVQSSSWSFFASTPAQRL